MCFWNRRIRIRRYFDQERFGRCIAWMEHPTVGLPLKNDKADVIIEAALKNLPLGARAIATVSDMDASGIIADDGVRLEAPPYSSIGGTNAVLYETPKNPVGLG